MSIPSAKSDRPTIRPARPADEPAIRTCAGQAYGQYVALIGREPAPMSADFAQLIADGVVHVATDRRDALLGYVVIIPQADHMALDSVAVMPSANGTGLGRALVSFCEDMARQQGLPAVELYTNARMTANLSLYPHLGYVETGRHRQDGFDRVFFRKTLT